MSAYVLLNLLNSLRNRDKHINHNYALVKRSFGKLNKFHGKMILALEHSSFQNKENPSTTIKREILIKASMIFPQKPCS